MMEFASCDSSTVTQIDAANSITINAVKMRIVIIKHVFIFSEIEIDEARVKRLAEHRSE